MAKKDEEPYRTWKREDPSIDEYKMCPKCKGSGDIKVHGEFIQCPKCKGEGTVRK